jgi:hypothetical protein
MRALAMITVLLAACACEARDGMDAEADASADSNARDVGTDADVCPDHALIRAPGDLACREARLVAPTCEALVEAPTFEELGTEPLCDLARRSTSGSFRDELVGALHVDATCEGTSFLVGGHGYRVDPNRHTLATLLVASEDVARVVADARITEGGDCVRRLRVELGDGGGLDILDLPSTGGTVTMQPASDGSTRSLTLTPIPIGGTPCPTSAWVCVTGDMPFAFADPSGRAFAPCGTSILPPEGCGTEIGGAIIGSASCGARLHAALFDRSFFPDCH